MYKSEQDILSKIDHIINYLRKSRRDIAYEKRTGEDTLNEQSKLMRRVLDDIGIPYDQEFEVGSGDKISTRPIFQKVMELLEQRKYNAIAVKEISRLGRGSYEDMGRIFTLIEENRIYIITPSRIYDPKNESDRRQIRFELFFAREEFEQIRSRMVGAKYAAAMEGRYMSSVLPFGYDRDENSYLIINEREAEIVKFIFGIYINGYNGREMRSRAIATLLTSLGYPTPKGKKYWSPYTVRQILKNEVYLGRLKYRTTELIKGRKVERPEEEHIVVDDAHEALIRQEDYDRVQAIHERRPISPVKVNCNVYPLTGILKCHVCGGGFNMNKKLTNNIIAARCNNMCCSVKQDVILKAVYKTLEMLGDLSIEELQKAYHELNVEKMKQEQIKVKQSVEKSIEAKKDDIQKRLRFIQEKHFNGVYSDDDYLHFKKQLEQELDALNGVEEIAVGNDVDFDSVKNKTVRMLDLYFGLETDTQKNNFLKATFESIELEVLERGTKAKETKIKITPKLSIRLFE